MRAAVFHRHGGPEVLGIEEVPEPRPAPGEALVAVRAVGLNHLDVHVRRGLPLAVEMPHIGGVDFAGEVSQVGSGVDPAWCGRRVVGYPVLRAGGVPIGADGVPARGPYEILGEQRNGACCERLALPVHNLVTMPERLSFEQAAALPVAFLTAWTMLVERARLREGETVLIQGAGSGVGSAGVQIAKLVGARVIACSRSADKLARARKLGADEVVDASRERTHLRVHRITGRRGADVVFEHVGADTWDESIRSAAHGGRVVTCGATTGPLATTHLGFVFSRQLSIEGVTLGSRTGLETVLAHVEAGRLEPVVDCVLPLEDVRRAHEWLESARPFGKIVLTVKGGLPGSRPEPGSQGRSPAEPA